MFVRKTLMIVSTYLYILLLTSNCFQVTFSEDSIPNEKEKEQTEETVTGKVQGQVSELQKCKGFFSV